MRLNASRPRPAVYTFLYLWEDFHIVQTTHVHHFHRIIIDLLQAPLCTIKIYVSIS